MIFNSNHSLKRWDETIKDFKKSDEDEQKCRMSKFLLKGGAKSINFEMIYEETSEVLISVFARKIFNSRK